MNRITDAFSICVGARLKISLRYRFDRNGPISTMSLVYDPTINIMRQLHGLFVIAKLLVVADML